VTQGAPPGPAAGFRPVLAVEAVYPGASAQTVAEAVAAPIESEVNGVEHLALMVSRCTNDGRYMLLLSFGTRADLNFTQVLVQNRINIAMPRLPQVLQNNGVTTRKLTPGTPLIVLLTSPDDSRDVLHVGNYASIQIKEELRRLAGVGEVALLGREDQGVRVLLNREKLAARSLTPGDVLRALREQNVGEKPAEQPSAKPGEPFQLRLETLGRRLDANSLGEVILKTVPGGGTVRLRDVARMEVGRGSAGDEVRFDGRPAAALAVSLLPTARPREVSAAVRERMERLKQSFPPGLDYALALDLTPPGAAGRPASPWCLLAEPVLASGASAERILECRDRYADLLRKTEGVRHVLSLPEDPFARFRGGPCVVALFATDMKAADWEHARQTVRGRLGHEVRSAAVRLRELSGPAGLRLEGYPLDLALRGPEERMVREFGKALAARLIQTGKLTDVATGPESAPRIDVDINRQKASALGVSTADIIQLLQVAFGPVDPDEFNPPGRAAKVAVRLVPRGGDAIADIKQLKVRNAGGQMVPLSSFLTVRETDAPTTVDRVDLWPAATISANPAAAVSPAEARWLCEALAEQVRKERRLPADYGLVWLQELPAPRPVPGGLNPVPEPPAPEVTVARPVAREVTDYQDFTGRIEATQSVDLRARVSGYLDKVLFKDGADVKKGDALFVIQQKPYQDALHQAEAQLKLAEAQRDLGKRNLERLRAQGADAPQGDLDIADAHFRVAAAQVDAVKAAVEAARMTLDSATIRAPIDGRSGRHLVDPGNLVRADETLLANLVSQDAVHVYFDVDERTLLRLEQSARQEKARPLAEAELPVSVGLADEAAPPRRGSINFVDNRVNPETGALTVRAVLPNTDRALRPGLFARVRVPVGAPHKAVLIPEEAIGSDLGQRIVYIVDDANIVVSREVVVGAKHDGLRVVTEGLRPDDRVVVEGRTRVRPGQTVKPVVAKP
jgi:RND family efflux transporter MFP subunit